MNLWISLDKDFEELFLKLERESKEYMVIEGLTTEKLDPTRFFKGFLKSGNVADASIDPNSNVSAQNITTLLHEMGKPMQKLLSFNKIYIELKEEFGKDVADEALKAHIFGDILIHDNASTFRSYCFAYSLKDIAEKGLFFINEMKALPPKHLDSFNSLTMETCAFLTNLQNGAVGLVDYLLYSFYFWNKDVSEGFIPKEKSTYIKEQQFQKMIFEFNQPYLKINQSMYGNLTIFDREYFAGLFGGLEFPNGTYAIDFVEEFMEYQKDFLNYERALRKKKSFTFPVLTFSGIFKNDKWLDEDMAKFIVKHNMEWADVNIYKSENPEAISACCFVNNQEIAIKHNNVFEYGRFDELYKKYKDETVEVVGDSSGNIKTAKIIKRTTNENLSEIKLTTGSSISVSKDHLHFTLDGIKETKELSIKDYILINDKNIENIHTKDYTYSQGFLMGAFLGDGYYGKNIVNFVFEKERKEENILPRIKQGLIDFGFDDLKIHQSSKRKRNKYICSKEFETVLQEFIPKNNASKKELNMNKVLNSSYEFKQGIIDGLMETDGNKKSNRIYSTSLKMIKNIQYIGSLLGYVSNVDENDKRKKVVIKDKEYDKKQLYCLRFYITDANVPNKKIYKNGKTYIKISEINEIKNTKENKDVYCFVLESADKKFMLPNGILTHNCRAEFNLEDIKESKKLTGNSNSIGGTDLGTGSSLVIDINLARVGYEAKGDYAIAKTLIKRRVELAQKIHYVHREKILRKNIERDLLPNYSYGLMKLESQYATIGIASMTEFVELMGGLDKNNIGEYFFNDKGIEYLGGVTKYINELGDDTLDKYKYTQSQEVSPNESGAIRLLKKDKLYFKDYPIDKVAYSNQFCDLSMSFPISERIRVDGILANKMNGGNILHLNLGEKWGNFEDAWKFNLEVAKSGSKYWSEIRKFQYCENDHNFFGTKCPICGLDAKGDILKVVGYLVKNEYYQKERREEMDNRIFYSKKDINKLK